MNDTTWQRLFGFRHAFDDSVTVVLTVTAVVLLFLAPFLIFITTRTAKSTAEKRKELWALHSDSHPGRRFLDDPGCSDTESALLSRVCPYYWPFSRTHHQFHCRHRHSPDHVCRTGQLVPSVCCVVSLDRGVNCCWRVNS
jgi:hypothetical protein